MIELDERVMAYERVRAVSAEWSELLTALARCAHHMGELGEANHARALEMDAGHLLRRARLHLKQVAAQEAGRGISIAPPASSRPPTPLMSTMPPDPEIPKLKAIRT